MHIVFSVLGIFLIYQWVGIHAFFSFLPRLTISSLNDNMYLQIIGIISSRCGLLLGIVGLGIGILYFIEKKIGGAETTPETSLGKAGYLGILMSLAVISVGSIV